MASISSVFERDEFKKYARSWAARQKAIKHGRGYYDGSAYDYMNLADGFFAPKLYRQAKALYMPLFRSVEVDAGLIPGGWKLDDKAKKFQTAVDQVFDWSKWSTEAVLLTRWGASTGSAVLKIVTDPEAKQVYLQPIDPAQVMIVGGFYNKRPTIAFTVLTAEDEQGDYEYAEVVTPQAITTYRNGEPFAFGDRPAQYPNKLGFVPFVECGHVRVSNNGAMPGQPTFHNAIPMLDRVNDLGVTLVEVCRKNAEPQWAFKGVEPSDLTLGSDYALFLPKDGDAKSLTPQVDIHGWLELIDSILSNINNGLPELAYDDLRKMAQIATATLTTQLGELCIKIGAIRPNYDAMLTEALRLAGQAGKIYGITEIAGLTDMTDKTFDAERPILPLDPETQLRLESMELTIEAQKKAMSNTGEGAYPTANQFGRNRQMPTQEMEGDMQNVDNGGQAQPADQKTADKQTTDKQVK